MTLLIAEGAIYVPHTVTYSTVDFHSNELQGESYTVVISRRLLL